MNFSGISHSNFFGRLLRWPLRLIPKSAKIPIQQGRLRGYRWIVGAGNHGCWLGSYEHDKQSLFAQTISRGAVLYDVGANVGFYTLLAAELVGPEGRVIAFEPVPRNLDYLRRHVSLNKLLNVEVIDAAVSDCLGVASFDDSRNPSMGQLANAGSLQVRLVTLDDLIANGTIPPPSFIKIDVEGAEDAVLRGSAKLLAEHRPTIFLATHGDDVRARCLERLAAVGYHVQPISGVDPALADEFMATSKANSSDGLRSDAA